MYKREGFREVTRLGKSTVLMQCVVPSDKRDSSQPNPQRQPTAKKRGG